MTQPTPRISLHSQVFGSFNRTQSGVSAESVRPVIRCTQNGRDQVQFLQIRHVDANAEPQVTPRE